VIAVDRTILPHPKNATSRPAVAGLPVQTAEMVCPQTIRRLVTPVIPQQSCTRHQ